MGTHPGAGGGRSPEGRQKSGRAPRLGIFFLVGRRLHVASCEVAECEAYGESLNFPGSHIRYWAELRRARLVPDDSEYDEYPRGRAVLDRRSGRASLYADRCILRRGELVARILRQLRLPAGTGIATDPHYRCPRCLGRGRERG